MTLLVEDESLLPSTMPVTTRSKYRALIAERDASIETVLAPVSDMSEYNIYKEDTLKLYNIAVNNTDGIYADLYKNIIEFLLQDDMLKIADAGWIIIWIVSIRGHIDTNKSSPHIPFLENAITILQNHLEDDSHYTVSAAKFIEIYEFVIDFMGRQEQCPVAMYVSALVTYMTRAAEGVWNGIELEKKNTILIRMRRWKKYTLALKYGLIVKCDEFLAKYKITA